MPNLSSFFPVEILACVFASTSGFTRIVIGAITSRAVATVESSFISGSLSTLNCRIPPVSAISISARVLPTPEKTIRSPGTPAARARLYSPPETTSMPAPASPSNFKIAWFEAAFIA